MVSAHMLATVSRSLHPNYLTGKHHISRSDLVSGYGDTVNQNWTLTLLLPWPDERDNVNFTTTVECPFSYSIAFKIVIPNAPRMHGAENRPFGDRLDPSVTNGMHQFRSRA